MVLDDLSIKFETYAVPSQAIFETGGTTRYWKTVPAERNM